MKSIRPIFSCSKHFKRRQSDRFSVQRSEIWTGFEAGTVQEICLSSTQSRPSLRPYQPATQCMEELLLLGKVTTYEAESQSAQISSWSTGVSRQ